VEAGGFETRPYEIVGFTTKKSTQKRAVYLAIEFTSDGLTSRPLNF
jgi:hypothetical protein